MTKKATARKPKVEATTSARVQINHRNGDHHRITLQALPTVTAKAAVRGLRAVRNVIKDDDSGTFGRLDNFIVNHEFEYNSKLEPVHLFVTFQENEDAEVEHMLREAVKTFDKPRANDRSNILGEAFYYKKNSTQRTHRFYFEVTGVEDVSIEPESDSVGVIVITFAVRPYNLVETPKGRAVPRDTVAKVAQEAMLPFVAALLDVSAASFSTEQKVALRHTWNKLEDDDVKRKLGIKLGFILPDSRDQPINDGLLEGLPGEDDE